jgi:hypothetical protein
MGKPHRKQLGGEEESPSTEEKVEGVQGLQRMADLTRRVLAVPKSEVPRTKHPKAG